MILSSIFVSFLDFCEIGFFFLRRSQDFCVCDILVFCDGSGGILLLTCVGSFQLNDKGGRGWGGGHTSVLSDSEDSDPLGSGGVYVVHDHRMMLTCGLRRFLFFSRVYCFPAHVSLDRDQAIGV